MEDHTYIEIDIDEVDKFVHSSDFHYYLVNNVTDFNTAAFILQTLLDAVEAIKKQCQGDET